LLASWTRADAADVAALGDPLGDPAYAVCVFDERVGIPNLMWRGRR
jgi:hypothetical protein